MNPDYIFLIKGSWAPVLICELMMLNLKVTEIISPENKDYSILVIYFSDEVLDFVAEINKIDCRLLGKKYTAQFKTYASDLYEKF